MPVDRRERRRLLPFSHAGLKASQSKLVSEINPKARFSMLVRVASGRLAPPAGKLPEGRRLDHGDDGKV